MSNKWQCVKNSCSSSFNVLYSTACEIQELDVLLSAVIDSGLGLAFIETWHLAL